MTNFLTLSTGTTNTAVARVAPITGVTPAQSRVRQTLGGLNQAYSALSMIQKGGWQAAANTLNRTENRTGRHKLTPNNAFVTLNSALLACGQATVSDAPADLTAPPILPPVTLQGIVPAAIALHQAGTITFSLHLVSLPYSPSIHVLAAPSTPAGKNTFPDNAFKTIGSLNGLEGGGTDIADLYNAVYGAPEVGSQIAVKLIATSASGIRLSPLVLSCIVTSS